MLEQAKIEDISKIVELKIKMFIESGHFDLLADNASQIIFDEYVRLYTGDLATHFVVKKNDEIVAMSGAFIKSDLPYCFFK